MELRAVLFDYGHTLLDFHRTEDALLAAYEQARELVVEAVEDEAGVPQAAQLAESVTQGVDRLVEASYVEQRLEELDIVRLFDDVLRGLGFELGEELVRAILELDHLAWRRSMTLPDDTREVLESLRSRGLKLGFVSNAHFMPSLLRADLEHLGLDVHFDGGAFSSEVGTRKPDPRIFHHVLAEVGAQPGEAVHVGDRVRDDIGGARAAGLAGGILTRQWRQEEPGGHELAVIGHLRELLELLSS